jgi:hypothetical protein
MDFFNIGTKEARGGIIEVFPDFTVGRSKDLMVRGQSFYAIWDEERGLWSTDEYDVQRLVDEALHEYTEKLKADGVTCTTKYLRSFNTNTWNQFRKFVKNVSDNAKQLDMGLTFSNTDVKKTDYVSRRLPYALTAGEIKAWDELIGTLYAPEERAKIEWAIGAVISGDSKKIQKFLVLYGPGGTGKSTVLNIIQMLFEGYTTSFEAKALVGNNNSFATEAFKSNPLVAIQHDGDLSKIEDNTKLNSIISHEAMTMNEKYKPTYTDKIHAFLFMGTNKPVKITDAKSGIIRRLIDVNPTGMRIKPNRYNTLMSQIEFELGAIAQHCLDVYREMGKNYYNTYQPLAMMLQTDVFFNFIEAHYDIFKAQDGASLKQAYALYRTYVEETGLEFKMPQYKFREELRNYFSDFKDRHKVDGYDVRSYYSGFTAQPYKTPLEQDSTAFSLVVDEDESLFDQAYWQQPAQYATDDGTPSKKWDSVTTVLGNLETDKLHFVKVPLNHIVIDFDLRGDDGEKSLEANLEAASAWPATYAELSKSGQGVHLHYIYTGGDVGELAAGYSDGIEIKVFTGNSSLRRRLTKCNNVTVAEINSGLPFKEKKMLQTDTLQSERGLRELVARNLRKEIHPGTKPSIDFIAHILNEAYESGLIYDVTDLRPRIMAFANNSSNQPLECLKTVQRMKFKTDDSVVLAEPVEAKDERLVFFDVEVYENLFVVCWSYEDSDTIVRMINPSSQDIEGLFGFKLVGFNNRKYDNHILWGAFMGYTNQQLYELSQKLISNDRSATFGEAYNLSYTDIYDFSSKKQGLKKFGIELGMHHMEMDLPWDKPVDPKFWDKVVEYCCNDVKLTKATFKARFQDFVARQILADLSGLSVNDTTQKHTARIVFGNDRTPQQSFVYTDLSKEFPGYKFDPYAKLDKSTYRGEVVGEGGYVYAEPGMYENVVLLDVASMHPTSIEVLEAFGHEYTGNFAALKKARMAIKHKAYDSAGKMFDGRLAPYLENEQDAEALAYALKIVINIVYGLTSAKFDNPFKDRRNVDNIVAKRGALFMIDLKHAVQEQGFQVVHIKTDSIKIPNATSEIIEFVTEFGKKYGYDFEFEGTYDKFCLVNDAVYIARMDETDPPGSYEKKWTAVGAQFQHPYVYKTLFTGEPITFDDMCETKSVQAPSSMYLDFDAVAKPMYAYEGMHFVGRTGRFVPVDQTAGGGLLMRVKDDKSYAVQGTKGYFWVEAEMMKHRIDTDIEAGTAYEDDTIDLSYFERLVDEARQTIEKFGDYHEFVS